MLRVLHIVPTYLPALRYGGPIFAVHALCAALARRGCAVSVYTTSVDGPGDSDVPLDEPVMRDGVSVRYFRSPWLRRLYYAPGMARALRGIGGQFDLVHLHSVFLWPTWAGARAARSAGIPYLLSPRGMLVEHLIARRNAWVKRAWIRAIEADNLARAAAVHFTSRVEAEEFARLGLPARRTIEVPNGVDLDPAGADLDPAPAAEGRMSAEAARAFASGRPVILCLGRIHWKKGLDRLVAALARLPEASLLFVGNDEDGLGARLRAQARALGIADRLFLAGPAYGPEKRAILRRATLFALASHSENFGNVVLEAMAEGCPVVVTPGVGAASIVESAGAGVVAAGEPETLAEAMEALIRAPEARREMGRRGRAYLGERLSWDAVAGQMLDGYRQVLPCAPGRGNDGR